MVNNGKLSKDDSKYLKTALRLLRQGNSMVQKISETTDISIVSSATQTLHNEIDMALYKIAGIEDYIATGKFVQLSLDFDEQ